MFKRIMLRVSNGMLLASTVVAVSALVALVSINALEITLRSLFNTSLSWIIETNMLLASWLYFIGIMIVYHHAGDITVGAIHSVLPRYARRIYARLIHFISAATFLICAWYTWRLVQLQWPFHTPGVGYPRPLFTAPLFIGLIGIAFECLRRALLEPEAPEVPSMEV